MTSYLHAFALLSLLLIAACAPIAQQENTQEEIAQFIVHGTEGQLIELSPEALDPDDDVVTYSYSDPFDSYGRWQTRLGDEGIKYVTITADDGRGGTDAAVVKVIVDRANRKPVIDCEQIVLNEGDTVDLDASCTVTDEDEEPLIISYTGWMTGSTYATGYDDAGDHTVIITAADLRPSDERLVTSKTIVIVVQNTNRPPQFPDDFPTTLTGLEKDVFAIPTDGITDPDGDKVTVTFSEPFDKDGIWRSALGDAGPYRIDVVASDGAATVSRSIEVEVGLLNTPPILERVQNVHVKEGETITLDISAHDREGDALHVEVTGWMTSQTYATTYDDAGEYTATVVVTDGVHTVTQRVDIVVEDRNRPPYFVTPA